MQIYGMTGEVLGPIGRTSEPPPTQLPAWKQDFLSKPSVSTRKGIAWGFDAAYEDTDTLVLTAPSGHFVDVRFPKDTKGSLEAIKHPAFWAFSGISKTTFYDADGSNYAIDMPYTAHCQFLHDIDSRGPGIVDEGDMFLLANGECLEMGTMMNPASGKPEVYKERWVVADMLPALSEENNSKFCVLAHGRGLSHVKGVIIRVGSVIQGIVSEEAVDKNGKFEIGRWQRDFEGKWLRDPRSNQTFPIEWLNSDQRNVGDRLDEGGISWRIAEINK